MSEDDDFAFDASGSKNSEGKNNDSDSLSDTGSGSDSLTPSEEESSTETDEESDEFELNTNDNLSKASLVQKKSVTVDGQHFDEAMELSASEQSIMSDAGPGRADPEAKIPGSKSTEPVTEEHYDEALDLSASERSVLSVGDDRGASVVNASAKAPGAAPSSIKNSHHDEAIALDSDSDASVDSTDLEDTTDKRSLGGNDARGDSPPSSPPASNDRNAYKDLVDQKDITEDSANLAEQTKPKLKLSESSSGTSDTETSDSDSDSVTQKRVTPVSNARGLSPVSNARGDDTSSAASNKDYSHLNVSSEIKAIFQFIDKFKPAQLEIESKIKCFIPDYMPSIGTIDAFVKVSRPDSKPNQLGLTVVDEPAANQSDATVLELQFMSTAKKQIGKRLNIRSIERAEKSPAEINRWIESIADLHRNKPPPTVSYTKSMPDIESLMQVWPKEFESALKELKLPSADLDLTTKEFATVACALVDVPVYNSIVQSLHVLFTLYSEFQSNQHFTNLVTENADETIDLSSDDMDHIEDNVETPPSSPHI